MLTLLHHAVKHFTPLWQRNLSLLFAVSFMGMTLSLFLLLPNPNSSILNIPFFTDLDQGNGSAELAEVHVAVVVDRGNRVPVLYVTPQRDLVCSALPSSIVSRPSFPVPYLIHPWISRCCCMKSSTPSWSGPRMFLNLSSALWNGSSATPLIRLSAYDTIFSSGVRGI